MLFMLHSVPAAQDLAQIWEGLYHVAHEASFEAKASEESRPGVGSRRVIVVAGERRIRGDHWAGSGYADAEHRSEPRNHSR
jgi:hypothetical protein